MSLGSRQAGLGAAPEEPQIAVPSNDVIANDNSLSHLVLMLSLIDAFITLLGLPLSCVVSYLRLHLTGLRNRQVLRLTVSAKIFPVVMLAEMSTATMFGAVGVSLKPLKVMGTSAGSSCV